MCFFLSLMERGRYPILRGSNGDWLDEISSARNNQSEAYQREGCHTFLGQSRTYYFQPLERIRNLPIQHRVVFLSTGMSGGGGGKGGVTKVRSCKDDGSN